MVVDESTELVDKMEVPVEEESNNKEPEVEEDNKEDDSMVS